MSQSSPQRTSLEHFYGPQWGNILLAQMNRGDAAYGGERKELPTPIHPLLSTEANAEAGVRLTALAHGEV